MADSATLLVLVVSAFVPPLLFVGVIRRTERYGQEPFGRVLRTFVWGAVFGVIIAVVLSLILITVLDETQVYKLTGPDPRIELILLALIVAPFTEEFAKGIGVFLRRRVLVEPEDGFVYGAASGLGFAATENVLYGLAGFTASGGSLGVGLMVIGVRSISSALLHASSTATFGYGIARKHLWPQEAKILPYYLLAVLMHAGFNLLASLGQLITSPELGDLTVLIGLGGAIILAIVAFAVIRAKIRAEDQRHVTF